MHPNPNPPPHLNPNSNLNPHLSHRHRHCHRPTQVGESCVEPTLARHPVGVARCGAASGRVFRGTIMVEPEQYRGDARLGAWFELAAAHNRTLEAKAPSDKPRTKKGALASRGVAGEAEATGGAKAKRVKARGVKEEEAEEAEVMEASDSEDDAQPEVAQAEAAGAGAAPPSPPRARPASTSGGQFALCVRAVISHIPLGKVAAYGQVAALAGAPRNARQVGRMLGEGLCYGGAPWHRVLGASGKISLPAAGGGDTQRRLLREEGVAFRESGAVAPGTFWERVAPFFQ